MNNSPLPLIFNCDTKAADKLKNESGNKYHIQCPKKCYTEYKNKEYSLYGNHIHGYTFDSSVCIAAMHAGLLSDIKSSDVSIEIIQKDAKYECN